MAILSYVALLATDHVANSPGRRGPLNPRRRRVILSTHQQGSEQSDHAKRRGRRKGAAIANGSGNGRRSVWVNGVRHNGCFAPANDLSSSCSDLDLATGPATEDGRNPPSILHMIAGGGSAHAILRASWIDSGCDLPNRLLIGCMSSRAT